VVVVGGRNAQHVGGLERCLSRLQHAHDGQPLRAVAEWSRSRQDAVNEVLTLEAKWLRARDVRDADLAVAVRKLEPTETARGWGQLHAFIENTDLVESGNIVVDGHLLAADNRELANFDVVEPADMDCRADAVREAELQVGDVFDAWLDVGAAGCADGYRLGAQHIQQDRNVMRSKIP